MQLPRLDRVSRSVQNRSQLRQADHFGTPALPAISYAPSGIVNMTDNSSNATKHVPDVAGRFGDFGGRYVPETLTRALDELAAEYDKARQDADFQTELDDLLKNYVGRPSPLYHARRLSDECGGAQIWLKREDLNHTGAHKINNTLGMGLLTGGWASGASSPKLARASMEWRPRPHVLALACRVSSIWGLKISAAKPPTCSA